MSEFITKRLTQVLPCVTFKMCSFNVKKKTDWTFLGWPLLTLVIPVVLVKFSEVPKTSHRNLGITLKC